MKKIETYILKERILFEFPSDVENQNMGGFRNKGDIVHIIGDDVLVRCDMADHFVKSTMSPEWLKEHKDKLFNKI